MSNQDSNRRDSKDTLLNGVLMGVIVPFLGYILIIGVNSLLIKTGVFASGLSFKFICMLAVLANVLPIQIFHRQHRDYASRGTMLVTMILVFGVIFYFKDQLLG